MMTTNAGVEARSAQVRPGADEEVLPLPQIPEALAAVRHRARAVLACWDLPSEVADDALLVISEMAANAVTHALPPATLRLSRLTGRDHCILRIAVTDTGPAPRSRRETCDADPEEYGRGISIIAALSVRCGICVRRDRVTRWADLRWV